jgi:hypothetical protein
MLRKFCHKVLDILFMRFNFLSKSISIQDFFSSEISDLLKKSSVSGRYSIGSKRINCIIHNKIIYNVNAYRINRDNPIAQWTQLGLKAKYNLLRNELLKVTLYTDEAVNSWDYLIYRDKESKKCTFFTLKEGKKRIIWNSMDDFQREIDSKDHFARNGISVLDFDYINENHLIAEQKLIGSVGHHPETLKPFDDELLMYTLRTGKLKLYDLPRVQINDIKLKEVIDMAFNQINSTFWLHNNKVPQVYVHGDLSPYNIIRSPEQDYLIDFDRSIDASAYYDFVYVWVNQYDRNTSKLRQRIKKINQKFYGEYVIPDKISLDLAISFFIMDVLHYMNLRCSSNQSNRFQIFLLNRIKEKWDKVNKNY